MKRLALLLLVAPFLAGCAIDLDDTTGIPPTPMIYRVDVGKGPDRRTFFANRVHPNSDGCVLEIDRTLYLISGSPVSVHMVNLRDTLPDIP